MPRDLPRAERAGYTERGRRRGAAGARSASGGRTFLLFTTLRALRAAASGCATRFAREGLRLSGAGAGRAARSTELLERFRDAGNAVLRAAAQSFWEGVDVPRRRAVAGGDRQAAVRRRPTIRCWRRASQRLEAEGGNAFMRLLQCRRRRSALKQGAGRLIRDETDRGVLVICDPRLIDKPYGRRIWQSLPPMRRTRAARRRDSRSCQLDGLTRTSTRALRRPCTPATVVAVGKFLLRARARVVASCVRPSLS